jgi:hypothetical protein
VSGHVNSIVPHIGSLVGCNHVVDVFPFVIQVVLYPVVLFQNGWMNARLVLIDTMLGLANETNVLE